MARDRGFRRGDGFVLWSVGPDGEHDKEAPEGDRLRDDILYAVGRDDGERER